MRIKRNKGKVSKEENQYPIEKYSKTLSNLGSSLVISSLEDGVKRLWKISKEDYPDIFFNSILHLKAELTERKPINEVRFKRFLTDLGNQINESLETYKYINEIKREEFDQGLKTITSLVEEFKNHPRASISDRKVCFPSKGKNLYLALSEPEEKFIVSHGFLMDAFPYIDFWFNKKEDKLWLARAYAKEVKKLADLKGIDYICLAIKKYGGKGPINLDEELEFLLRKNIFYYKQRIGKEDIQCNLKSIETDSNTGVVVLYDLGLTLGGIAEAKKLITDDLNCKFLGAVIFHNFSQYNRKEFKSDLKIGTEKSKLRVISKDYKFNNLNWDKIIYVSSENYPYLTNIKREILTDLGLFFGGITSLANPWLTIEVSEKIKDIASKGMLANLAKSLEKKGQ